jgi:hypothetical protein
MRKHYFILLNVVSIACFAQKSEEDAIKKVIQQETISFFHKDYEGWANCWMHDSAAYVTWSGTTEHTQLIGWNAIAARFKQEMKNMAVLDEALIAPSLNKTDHYIFINGNTAIVTFKEGITDPTFQTRSLVKQNGSWKILNSTLIVNSSYSLMTTIAYLRNLVGTWELAPGSVKTTPSNGTDYQSIRYDIRETSLGFELELTMNYVNPQGRNMINSPSIELFIPDNNQMEVVLMHNAKTLDGQIFSHPGKLTRNNDGSLTVKAVYPQKPTATRFEYTVNLKDGKWHQITNWYDIDGTPTLSFEHDMRRVSSPGLQAF